MMPLIKYSDVYYVFFYFEKKEEEVLILVTEMISGYPSKAVDFLSLCDLRRVKV